MTCKDCIHCEACERMISDTSKMFKVLLSEILKMNCDIKYDSTNILSGAEICQCFQDRSQFVELPCKKDDVIFCNNSAGVIIPQKVTGFIIRASGTYVETDMLIHESTIGDFVFLTREEAKQALKEREGK